MTETRRTGAGRKPPFPGVRPQPRRDRSEAFGKELRVRRRGDFLKVQRRGRRRGSEHFVVARLARRDGGLTRAGFTVSRGVGNAVARNRVKRRLREFFRKHRPELPGSCDLVFIARRGSDRLSYRNVERELVDALGLA